MSVVTPETAAQVHEFVTYAVANELPVEVIGRGSKRAIGRPGNPAETLSLGSLSGISLYEPEELVLTAGPGTPLEEVEAALSAANQELMFEPPDYGPLLTGKSDKGTLGGVVAANLAGPRRIKAGAARDHFLGFQAVSGRGEPFKSGGRVVKNVTGYDLCKLMAGSWGTLAVLTDVTCKVLPRAEKVRTILVVGADAAAGTAAMTRALGSPNEVSAAAWLPEGAAARSGVGYVSGAGAALAAIRVEGPAPSVAYRAARLSDLLSDLGTVEELHTDNSRAFWRELRDVMPFAAPDDDRVVWKVSVPPQDGAGVLAAVEAACPGAEGFLDWGGGLVWLAVNDRETGSHVQVRAAADAARGHATLVRGPEALRAAVPVFHPQSEGVAALSARVKNSFDPKGILNPGRMAQGR